MCPLSTEFQKPSALIFLVKTSASCSCVGTQCKGGLAGFSGEGSPSGPWRDVHWCRASHDKICRILARFRANLFSVGAFGVPSL